MQSLLSLGPASIYQSYSSKSLPRDVGEIEDFPSLSGFFSTSFEKVWLDRELDTEKEGKGWDSRKVLLTEIVGASDCCKLIT